MHDDYTALLAACRAEQVTLKLWVSNQVGVDSDCTANYIEAATSWKAPSGVTLDTDAQTISGAAEEAWAAYRSLAAAVAGVGHGTDFGGDDIEADEPTLTACPEQLVCEGYTCAAESLARLESPVQETWAGFVGKMEGGLAGNRLAPAGNAG